MAIWKFIFLPPLLPHHVFGNALCAQGVPDWGPKLKTTAASVGPNAPRQVASVVPRACTPVTPGYFRSTEDFVNILPSSVSYNDIPLTQSLTHAS